MTAEWWITWGAWAALVAAVFGAADLLARPPHRPDEPPTEPLRVVPPPPGGWDPTVTRLDLRPINRSNP